MSNQKYAEDEIDLRDYIKVILKRKKLILTVFFVTVITTTVVSLCMPKIYDVSMIIESSILDITSQGNQSYIDLPKNIKAKIQGKAFNLEIINALDLDLKEANFKFDVSLPKNSNLVQINIDQEEKKTKLGLKILNRLFIELSNSYKEMFEYKKKVIGKEISIISNCIAAKKDEIKLQEKKLKISEDREMELLAELQEVKNNSEKLISQRDTLLTDKGQTDNMASLLYSNVIQQNISYFNHLGNQLADLKTTKESVMTGIKNLEKEINNLQIEIEKTNLRKDNIRNIRLVREPEVSSYPIKPKKRQMVAISGIVSLMMGVFLAFFMEYWQSPKKT